MTDNMSMVKAYVEAAIIPLQNKVDALKRQVDDQGRQTSKDCIVFEGNVLKPLHDKELHKDTCIRVVQKYWGLTLQECELKQVKLQRKGTKANYYRMVAKFNQCWEGSNFHEILTNKAKVSKGENLWRSLHLVTQNDHRLSWIARQMRKEGELHSFIWHYVSGRLKVTYPGEKQERESFSDADALFAQCSERLQDKLRALDKEARARRGKQPTSSKMAEVKEAVAMS